ncbi:MAG TPA: DUF4956 domain-containing protein [Clostridiales bacterium]|nr:DUF4956 domain-containing protein [Clostridiales bacterium]
MFSSLLTDSTTNLSYSTALICIGSALLLGFLISVTYMLSGKYSKSFAVSLVVLPVIVQVVIMMVNGNLGTGVAILGAFSLVRFRSVPGKSKDICVIFFAMAVGLAVGMGQIVFAAVITVIVCAVYLVLSKTHFAEKHQGEKELKITIPEDLDYTDIFDDVFAEYTTLADLETVKTTNLGSMYQLTYCIILKNQKQEKAFIDALRCRNGNLNIVCGRSLGVKEEL